MVLDQHRDRLDWWLVPLAKSLRKIHPNWFTWMSLVCALGAGYFFYASSPAATGFLLIGWGLLWANGILDVLDGKVAKLTGKTSAKGDYLDHAIDRFSDVAFLAGLSFSPFVRIEIGLAAIVFTLLTSYLGTQAQAVGIGRNYGGFLGRADRMALLLLAPPIQAILSSKGVSWPVPYTTSLLEVVLIYFAVVGLITTVQRFVGGLSAFDASGQVRRE